MTLEELFEIPPYSLDHEQKQKALKDNLKALIEDAKIQLNIK